MANLEVTLGGTVYSVPPITVGQLEAIASLTNFSLSDDGKLVAADGSSPTSGLIIKNVLDKAQILFKHASPKLDNVRDVPCSVDDVVKVVSELMRGTGLVKENPVGNGQAGE